MWPFRRKVQPRRPEPRRTPREEPGAWRRFRQAGGVGSLVLATCFLAAVLVMDAWPLEPLTYRVRQYVPEDIYARVPFEQPSPTRTARQREAAAKLAPAVIVPDDSAVQRVLADIKNLPGRLKSATQPGQVDEAMRRSFALDRPEQLAAFARYADPAKATEYQQQVDRLGTNLLKRLLVTGQDFGLAYHAKDTQEVQVASGPHQGVHPKSLLLSLDNARELGRFLKVAGEPLDDSIRENILYHLQEVFAGGMALFRLDEQATRSAEEAARAAVKTVTETVPAGQRLVSAGAEGGLTQDERALLAKAHDAYLRQRDARQGWLKWCLLGGRAIVVLGVVALLCLYVAKYMPRVVSSHRQGLGVLLVLSSMLLVSKVFVGIGGLNPYFAVLPVFLGATVLTIAYEQRFAFGLSGALVVLTGLQLRLNLDELLVLWSAAAVTVFLLREVRTRSRLIETGGVAAVVALAATAAVEAAAGIPGRFLLVDGCWAALWAIVGGLFAQAVLPLVERVFGVATPLTLLEWCDASKPLLRRLALEAPGTYSHSLLLGSTCETAADAIGARGLLARVGAYYHDVGKIHKPDYFVENRAGPGSRHDRLSPAMSLLVIKGHVKDGLQLAREYALPPVLRQFLATHHGTTLVEYFYHAAQRRSNARERPPEEAEFRYPGPKPQSKEAAILMLADASESSVRALGEPTAGHIETQVHAVVQKRLADGQLDGCDLTLRDVHAIEASLVRSLSAIYHGRVAYPSQGQPAQAAPISPAGTRALDAGGSGQAASP